MQNSLELKGEPSRLPETFNSIPFAACVDTQTIRSSALHMTTAKLVCFALPCEPFVVAMILRWPAGSRGIIASGRDALGLGLPVVGDEGHGGHRRLVNVVLLMIVWGLVVGQRDLQSVAVDGPQSLCILISIVAAFRTQMRTSINDWM